MAGIKVNSIVKINDISGEYKIISLNIDRNGVAQVVLENLDDNNRIYIKRRMSNFEVVSD
jgi:hypothetical protein